MSASSFSERCQRSVLLSRYTSFGIGGPADFFCVVKTVAELQEALAWADEHSISCMVLGKGSNTLFSDHGYPGLVILNQMVGVTSVKETASFSVGSGLSFAQLGLMTARLGFAGLEFAAGIPGTVGGAVVMNAGAFGQETFDTLVSVDLLDETREVQRKEREALSFGYRYSEFLGGRSIIVGANFSLRKDDEVAERQKQMMQKRRISQPYMARSAGSVFRNPPGTSAAMLIDAAGLKGRRCGGASVSTMHANFIINQGDATAEDVCSLISLVQEEVHQRSGVWLEHEIRVIG